MAPIDVDASNPCVPPSHPLVCSIPPLPSTTRGEPCVLDGKCGRINSDRPVLLYANGRLVVVRELDGDLEDDDEEGEGGDGKGGRDGKAKWKGGIDRPGGVKAFVYRGHTAQVTAAKFSPSGCYVASADVRGKLRVWSYDNEEHLPKLELNSAMAGPVRDISWDFESKRLCLAGQGSKTDASSECARVIQWDTGVTCGELGQHTRNRAVSCTFKPNRPMRIATGGGDDSRVLFNKGPPFVRVVDADLAENCHERGAVNCVRYSPDGSKIASVGTDRSVALYEGKTLKLLKRLADVHANSIYSCDWTSDSGYVLTCSADGTAKLVDAAKFQVVKSWDVLATLRDRIFGGERTLDDDEEDDEAEAPSGPPSYASSLSPTSNPPRGVASRFNSSQMSSQLSRPDMGGMQMGCALVAGDVPVSVCLNGEIAVLPAVPGAPSAAASSVAAAGARAKVKFLTGHQASISAMALDGHSGRLYTGDTDGVVCGWQLRAAGGGHAGGPTCRALGRIERRGGGGGGSLEEVGEEESGCEPRDDSLMDRVHAGAITAMECSGDGGTVLSAGWDDALRIGDGEVATRRVALEAQPNAMGRGTELVALVTVRGLVLVKDNSIVSKLVEVPYSPLSVCVSADDSTVIVGGEDCNIHVYSVIADSSSGGAQHGLDLEEVRSVEGGHLKPVHSLALSPDGSYLASADARDVCVWDVASSYAPIVGKSRWCFHTQRVTCLAWSPSGDSSSTSTSSLPVLASGGNDDSIYLWSLDNKMKRVHYPFAHRGGISGLAFLGSGAGDDGGEAAAAMNLVSVGSDGCVNVWDVAEDVRKKFG